MSKTLTRSTHFSLTSHYLPTPPSGLPDLSSGLRGRDIEGRGRLPAGTVRAAVKATRLPVPTLLVDALVSRWAFSCAIMGTMSFLSACVGIGTLPLSGCVISV